MISRKTEQAIRDTLQQSFLDNTTTGVFETFNEDTININNNNLALATAIVSVDGTTNVTSIHTGDFSSLTTNQAIIYANALSFVTTTPIASLFSVSGFVFNLTKSEIVSQSEQRIELLWTGTMVKSGSSKTTLVKVVRTPNFNTTFQVLSQPTLLPIPILISDQADVKPPMPYILVECGEAENLITPSSGIFKTTATICFKTHAKYTDGNLKTSPAYREQVIDLIDQFAYNHTASVLSTVANYHCHGWEQKELTTEVDNDQKSFTYYFNYDVTCMALDN